MKLRMYHVFALYLVHTYAQELEEPPPALPTVQPQLVIHFRLALEAVFGIGIRLQAFLQDEKNENFLVSPISAAVVIAQLTLGAEGEFRKQLIELLELPNSYLYENDNLISKGDNVTFHLPYSNLHLQLSALLKALQSSRRNATKRFKLTQKSALFVDKGLKINQTFAGLLDILYETRVHGVDFMGNPAETQSAINAWVSKSTNGLIETLLPSPPRPTTSSIFANAIYFKAEWLMPFSDTLNREGPFNVDATKQVPVTYMIRQLDQIRYSESKDYRMIALPYTNEEVGMYVILPKPDNPFVYDIRRFVQNLKSRELIETQAKGKRRDVVIKFPKMSLTHTFSILDQLKKYRAFKKQNIKVNATDVVDKLDARVDAFDNFTAKNEEDIYLTAAAVSQNLRVDDIVQQVVISVNEKGTEAAAVSASTIDYMGGSKTFVVDRPFVFFIRHEATGATLFWGTISNPAP